MRKSALKLVFDHKEDDIMFAYIYERYTNNEDIRIKDLAKRCFMSEPTITRVFCRLGFDGFKEFKYILMNEKICNIENYVDDARMDYQIFFKPLNQTFKMNRDQTFNLVAKLFLPKQNKKIAIAAIGGNSPSAYELKIRLSRMGYEVSYDLDSHNNFVHCANLKTDDILFAISYTGTTPEVLKCVDVAKQSGALVISITGNGESELVKNSNYVFYVNDDDNYLKIYNIRSKICIYYLVLKIINKIYLGNDLEFNRIQEANRF